MTPTDRNRTYAVEDNMTGLEALDNLIFTLSQLPKIAPPNEHPGLKAALEAAQAARADVDDTP